MAKRAGWKKELLRHARVNQRASANTNDRHGRRWGELEISMIHADFRPGDAALAKALGRSVAAIKAKRAKTLSQS